MESREKRIRENMNLVYKISKKFVFYKEKDSLIQEGMIGLIEAVDNYEPQRGCEFSSYAYPRIYGKMLRFMRDHREDIPYRIKRKDQEKFIQIKRLEGQGLDVKQIAQELGISIEEVKKIEMINQTQVYEMGTNGSKEMICNIIGEEDFQEEIVEQITVQKALNNLDEQEKKVIMLRYFEGKNQRETGEIIGVQQARISKIEKSAFKKIKKYISEGYENEN